jgi:ATP-binding cassette subfamily B (MDR/TAP) protein 8
MGAPCVPVSYSRPPSTSLCGCRMELFRTLLMQKVSYFDKHTAGELASLISIELDTIRSFVFR